MTKHGPPGFTGSFVDEKAFTGDSFTGPSAPGSGTTLSLSLSDGADPSPAGNALAYTASVTNTGTNPAASVSLVVTLDASLTFVSASGTGWTCGAVGQVVTCTVASLAPGAAPDVTINVTAGNSAITASTSGSVSATGTPTASDTETTVISKLTQTVVVSDNVSGAVSAGGAFNLTCQVHNSGLSGSGTAHNLSCAITVDSSLTIGSPTGTGWTIGVVGQVVTATIASLAVGDANLITIPVTAGNSALTAATSAALTADNATTANSGTHNVTVSKISTSVTVTDSADPVITGGDAFNYSIVAHNSDASVALSSLSVAFTVDSSLTIGSPTGTGWTIGVSGQVVTATRSTLAANSDAPTITVPVTTGGSAISASSSAQFTSANGSTSNGSQGTTVNLVSQDATSLKYCPATATEWSNFLARKSVGNGGPAAIWLFQDASGNAAEVIGTIGALTAAGTTRTYQVTETGWTRKAITFTDGGNAKFTTTSASLPDISTTSALLLMYRIITSSGSTRIIATLGTTTIADETTSTPRTRIAGGSTVTGSSDPTGAVRPGVLKRDKTNSADALYTDQEKLVPTFSASATGKSLDIGAASGTAAAMGVLYAVLFTGAAAELNDAAVKALLQALGWTIPWS